MLHRRIGDPQVALADRVIVGFNDVMCRGMQRGQHVAELVKRRQIIQRGIAAHIVKVPQIGCSGHGHKDRMPPPKAQVLFRVPG